MAPSSNQTPSTHVLRSGRQRPRTACKECRRRKIRCDGGQPQCGPCVASRVICEVSTRRSARGPKKGRLGTLKNRVAALESSLTSQQPVGRVVDEIGKSQSSPLPELSGQGDASTPAAETAPSKTDLDMPASSLSIDALFIIPRVSVIPSSQMGITELIHGELDQLYFDRVHPSIPILHQRRYWSWSRAGLAENKTSRTCLQYTMWTLSALLFAQFQHFQAVLYREAKQMLEALGLGSGEDSDLDVEQVQAWVLIATYESMKTHHRHAWMSTGRAFRLVQLMRIHDIDSPAKDPISDTDLIVTEEKRRAFWMAYLLDHLFSIRNGWPITLNEHVICTRLPAPEAVFQNGKPDLGSFLSEAITDAKPHSLFGECIILATICARSLLQAQQYHISCAYGEMAPDWPAHHRLYDSMLLFTKIMAQATSAYLRKGVDSLAWSAGHTSDLMIQCEKLALAAAEEVVDSAKALNDFHVFKIHPLTPIPLFLTAEFLYTHRTSVGPANALLQELLAIFRRLKIVNDTEESYMHVLGLSCIPVSLELIKDMETPVTSAD
ncbi:Zn(2)-Cys(6) zinc finger domain protein [Pleurostoma richardsiae]|uniref:Zn(2)-Cys(6) zinc finger domain protein n=1 Tax=Pleurostoma richardsiae TaxID=41990 RepID=A0AA38VH71_9PEZI|nr:Zn(2)-Cys(6) zinc finger domain protein [Pleurostoma richardsiae]